MAPFMFFTFSSISPFIWCMNRFWWTTAFWKAQTKCYRNSPVGICNFSRRRVTIMPTDFHMIKNRSIFNQFLNLKAFRKRLQWNEMTATWNNHGPRADLGFGSWSFMVQSRLKTTIRADLFRLFFDIEFFWTSRPWLSSLDHQSATSTVRFDS
jgi:hypothetical protein